MAELVIMQGLPRSGKSTYTKELQWQGYSILEVDQYRLDITSSIYSEDDEPYVWDKVREDAIKLLLKGINVVIDESNPTLGCIKFWYKIIDEFSFGKPHVKLIRLTTPADVCLSRAGDNLIPVIYRKNNCMINLDQLKEFCKSNKIELIIKE